MRALTAGAAIFAGMRSRPGFTLIEAMVALVLFEIAALALVATTAVATRDLASAERHSRAFALASDRVARLRGGACGAAAFGSAAQPGGLREHWRVEAVATLRVIVDSVEVPLPARRVGAVVVRGWEVCAP
jgi:Tfp pilus assembly protein PilV